ncbi:hypothetical protein [Mesorhizobium sp.]|uniref:hypothetical protein n=1 Tax=Mesorhizobium sp. TaxID=1871066 RepID=UPI000FE705CF|nr:hypothetical protein [Mesorhizobium sp.]RWE44233.1 MAG: hypothetical protein EOS80_20040 [Mesorhizobium sp.]
MRRFLSLTALGFITCLNAANAATWERPAGAYTPTNHSVNTTKYQTDRANGVAISSVKVDGDINKAFQGLNDIDARVAPSVVGQSGKYLTNDGANSSWGLVSSTSINSGASASGLVLKADGAGSAAFGLLTASSFADSGVSGTYSNPTISVNGAGLIASITSTQAISATTLYASNTLVVSRTGTFGGSLTAPAVSTSAITGTAANYVARAWVNFDGTGSIGAVQTIRASANVAQVWKVSGATYSISFSTPMPNANCSMFGSALTTSPNVGFVGRDVNVSNTTTSARVITRESSGIVDGKYVDVVFFCAP